MRDIQVGSKVRIRGGETGIVTRLLSFGARYPNGPRKGDTVFEKTAQVRYAYVEYAWVPTRLLTVLAGSEDGGRSEYDVT